MTGALSVTECVSLVRRGEVSVLELTERALSALAADSAINSFTAVTAERALADAKALDAARARGHPLPALAGVPYAVKNLFDVAGLTTVAGARLLAGNPPARCDANLVRRAGAAGAVLLGTLNMDAYAYGFTTENTHYGATRNPRDPALTAGGSSGGSGAAVAAGFVSFALGSDTNGSIRVPSSFCGTFGLKATFGRLSRSGAYPFVPSLDHVGPLARSAEDLATVFDALQGDDPADAAYAGQPPLSTAPLLHRGVQGLRVAVLGDYFEQWAGPAAREVVARAGAALGAAESVVLPGAREARAAAYVITAAESGAFYLDELRRHPEDFEPLSRERLMAGALLPSAWYLKAQRFRRWFHEAARQIFATHDVLIAPATPCTATALGAVTMDINGTELPLRPSIGLLTQPISLIGLPVAVAPLWTPGGLPLGVQLIAPPWREDLCLRAAWALEEAGLARAPVASRFSAAQVREGRP